VLRPPGVISLFRNLIHPTDVGDRLALGDLLFGRSKLTVNLFGLMPRSFHVAVPDPLLPNGNFHSLWFELRGPSHSHSATMEARDICAKPQMRLIRLLRHHKESLSPASPL